MTRTPPDGVRRHVVVVAVAWLVLTLLGEALVQLAAGGFPYLASREGAVTDEAIVLLLRLVVPVFMFVAVVVGYAMLRFRVPDDDVRDSQNQPRTDRRYVLTWLGVTTGLAVLVIVHPGVTGLIRLWSNADTSDPLRVKVTAAQWEWRFDYPRHKVANARELVLPVDRLAEFTLASKDVVHSFWVPAFRLKQDMIPGMTRTLRITPDALGSTKTDPRLRVQCAEMCGVGHSHMAAVVRVVTAEEFAQWVKDQAMSGMG